MYVPDPDIAPPERACVKLLNHEDILFSRVEGLFLQVPSDMAQPKLYSSHAYGHPAILLRPPSPPRSILLLPW